jgi:hypothetical protein
MLVSPARPRTVGSGTVLPAVTATRYVTPLREGGSLPGLMEADDLGTYVVKFHGAGQGRKALVAEVISGELARALELPVPALVTVEVDPALATNEPDQEVQDLLRASPGRNLGVDFLPGSLDLDATAFALPTGFAGRVLLFDALVGNVDRSWRNPNMLFWHGSPYLIDHGATLTFHHNWTAPDNAAKPYDAREHALLGCHPELDAAEAAFAPLLTTELLRNAIDAVPDGWLIGEPGFAGVQPHRKTYFERIWARWQARDEWLTALRTVAREHTTRERSTPPPGSGRPAWVHGAR